MSASVGEADAKADMAGVTNTEALVKHESVVKHASAVQHAEQLLQQGRPREAERLLRPVLAQQPEDVDAGYALAVAQRHQHQWQEALATLGGILQAQPNFGRAHQETGYNHIARRDFAAAREAFEAAVAADPALVNSWRCLIKLYEEHAPQNADIAAKRQAARDQVDFLATLPPELLAVTSYLAEDKLAHAERLCKHFLRDNKTHVEGMRLLAEILTRNKVLDEAEFLLESCVEFEPEHANARIQYVNILLRAQKFAKAFAQAERLLDANPNDTGVVRSLYAAAANGVGRTEDAIAGYRALMETHPSNHLYPVSLGHVHKAAGDLEQATALYQKAYGIKPDHGDAYWSLANTKSHVFTEAEVRQMLALEENAGTVAEEDRTQICFALGNAFETRGEYERAFEYYRRGNARKKAGSHHSPEQLRLRIDSQMEVCTAEFFRARIGVGHEAPDPIFVVGLPRAGSTLIEQILASHSQVDGTMELHNILGLAKRLRGRDEGDAAPRYPRILGELDADYFRRFGEQYINDTRTYRAAAPFFVDKMPNNFFHIGLIRLILPNAKVIDARRAPLACCFSGFKQLFGEGQEFSYDLETIGNYYRQYVKLMAHWDRVLPGFVLRVQHENVVDNLEREVRRVLDFCGLPFEEGCVQYHRTERSVHTPSAEQVRQPINRSGLEQWRRFEPWLDPLKRALGPELAETEL